MVPCRRAAADIAPCPEEVTDGLSETIVHELGTLLEAEMCPAGPALVAADLNGIEQRVQQVSRRVCGALLERVWEVRGQGASRPPALPRVWEPAGPGLRELLEQIDGFFMWGNAREWLEEAHGSARQEHADIVDALAALYEQRQTRLREPSA